jgi:hypothetical protein
MATTAAVEAVKTLYADRRRLEAEPGTSAAARRHGRRRSGRARRGVGRRRGRAVHAEQAVADHRVGRSPRRRAAEQRGRRRQAALLSLPRTGHGTVSARWLEETRRSEDGERGEEKVPPLRGAGLADPCQRRSGGTGEAPRRAAAWGRRAGSWRRRSRPRAAGSSRRRSGSWRFLSFFLCGGVWLADITRSKIYTDPARRRRAQDIVS